MKKDLYCLDHSLGFILAPPTHNDSLARPLPCHRLDSRVSGCLICAKSTRAQSSLAKQFQEHTIEKEYTAILVGDVQLARCTITDDIDGLESQTFMLVLNRTPCQVYGCLTTVRLLPKTGRRHQLRRHCAGLGHPILGDDLYHDPAGYVQKEHRLTAIGRISQQIENLQHKRKLAGTSNNCDGDGDGDGDVESADDSEVMLFDSFEYPRTENFKPVRRGVGLFLMSTAVSFYHPVKHKNIKVECDLAPRFHQVLRKAARGSDWACHTNGS